MSNSSHRATQPPGKSRRKNVVLDLATARQMLPLVRHIVAEIVEHQLKLDRLLPERELLDQSRRGLDWTGRQRRYSIQDDITRTEATLTGALHELDALGLTLVNPHAGEVDFPTKINGRPAAFAWQHGEETLGHWRYTGEDFRRQIPADWESGKPMRIRKEH